MISSVIIIPARYDSSRFPGKPLADIAGKSLLERVWRVAKAVRGIDKVVIATDDNRIFDHASALGAEAMMTSKECRNGTERVFEVCNKLSTNPEIIINLQGDTPLILPSILETLHQFMQQHPSSQLATPTVRLSAEKIRTSLAFTARGKAGGTFVTFNKNRKALYFSKNVIPFPRSGDLDHIPVYKHLGIYAFRYNALKEYLTYEKGVFEVIEELEQLRALENGMEIDIVEVDFGGRSAWSVDNPEDIHEVEEIIAREGEIV